MTRAIAALIFSALAAQAHAAEAELTRDDIHGAFLELCAKGQQATIAQCECAFPKVVAATEPDDVPYYVTSWLLSSEKAAKIASRHPSGWTKESQARRKAAQKDALAECGE
jgi:hypothetical protein